MITSTDLRDKVLLSIQKALLGKIESSVRGICINISNKTLVINAYYDTLPLDEQKKVIEEAAIEVLADVPELENFEIHCQFSKLSLPEAHPLSIWVYLRIRKEN